MTAMDDQRPIQAAGAVVVPLASSSNGRQSRKSWKPLQKPTVRTQTRRIARDSWDTRMEKTKKERAIKQLRDELKEEKQAERQRRRQITLERKKAAEERLRLEELKARVGTRKAARMRRKVGARKKING